ncbi:XRE family transcriptional regulator [Dubosiella newyorkensis]|jgi:repressor LexA|uniref:HTH cro/C1-type domain-containing protein n=1 Tax=Dubosiella newyorkensis TaxID=1862672 RepID=A0A1U7NLH6_9FIRM|nr:XRE family transcriptional regulator [Dubosiella newyorkensis]MCI9040539.1 LexA family transcriptional regulator [Dubosiella newyorkensis]OLU45580.1 hypothetical protein BO225_08005 [Dubosiella newyorkensis]
MSLSNQIRQARKRKKITQGDLAKMLGKTKNVISNWERGDNKPDADMILNLCRILDVDPNQILDWSEDQDYAELSTLEQKHIENYRSLESWQRKSIDELILRFLDHTEEETLTDTPVIQVPFYQVSPAAGSGNYMDENVDQETIELEDTPANRKIDYILKVDGHSMEPKFMDGEYVKVKKQQSVNIGEVGIFVVDGSSFIKEYHSNTLHSINPAYSDILLKPEMDVRCVGKVLGKFHR